MAKVKAVCIKAYVDESSLVDYVNNEISEDDLIIYSLGEEGEVQDPGYDPKFWRVLLPE